MEEIIRMIQMGASVYLHREDVIRLIKKVCERAESLNAKRDLQALVEALEGGDFDLPPLEGGNNG